MFLFLSRIIDIFLNPLVWVLIIGGFGLWKSNRWIIGFAFIFLYFIFLPYPAQWAISKWEYPSQPLKEEFYDIAIVLCGIATPQIIDPTIPLSINDNSERLITAISLYHEGKVGKILLSGGSGSILYPNFIESYILKNYTESLGVVEEDIIVESQSRNTHQNALYTSITLAKNFPEVNTLLITSGYHMERAILTFKKQGINPDPYPVDFKISAASKVDLEGEEKRITQYLLNLEPKNYALQYWNLLIHEIVGILIYTIFDYI